MSVKEKDPPAWRAKPAERAGRGPPGLEMKERETFYQDVIVTQKPNFSVSGLPVTLLLQYRVVSRFTVRKANDDGSLVVRAKGEKAPLSTPTN